MTLLDELKACPGWLEQLQHQQELLENLDEALKQKERDDLVLPPRGERLNALKMTPLSTVKVVILGQDPYPSVVDGSPNAMGLAFSVRGHKKPPASLKNIYRELEGQAGFVAPSHGDLSAWAKQGVLLLNTVLSVSEGAAGSHRRLGWQSFTQDILSLVARESTGLVFLSLGRDSHAYADLFARNGHTVIKTSHPSPLGAGKSAKDGSFEAFKGSDCFGQVNKALEAIGETPIDWRLPKTPCN